MIPQNSNISMDDVRQYLQMLQDIINRMASNSSNCKAWAITIFTAMSALMIGVEVIRQWMWIILCPIVLFYFLDAYYLGLENDFRNLEASFIKKLRASEECSISVYDFNWHISNNTKPIIFNVLDPIKDKFTAKTMLSNEKMHRYNLIWRAI